MGGEYLPDYRKNEVEIARIELQSTTSDVMSIRARRGPNSGRSQPFLEPIADLTCLREEWILA